jgi:homoserine kinase
VHRRRQHALGLGNVAAAAAAAAVAAAAAAAPALEALELLPGQGALLEEAQAGDDDLRYTSAAWRQER